MRKVRTYKSHVIALGNDGIYYIFTTDEWGYGKGLRSPEWEAGTIGEAIDWIDS